MTCAKSLSIKLILQVNDGAWKREGPPSMMVSQNSAMLHSAQELRAPCDADHSNIAKLKRGEASLYPIIRGHLLQALEKSQAAENVPMNHIESSSQSKEYGEGNSRTRSPGSNSSRQAMQDATSVPSVLEWQQRLVAPPLSLPEMGSATYGQAFRAPTVEEARKNERPVSALNGKAHVPPPPVTTQERSDFASQLVRHSPVELSARTSLIDPIMEARNELSTVSPRGGLLRPQSHEDKPVTVGSEFQEQFLDDVWDAQSDGSKYVVDPKEPHDTPPKQPEPQASMPPGAESRTEKDSMPTKPIRRQSKDIFSVFKRKNSKPDPAELLAAARENNVTRMRELLQAGGELESKTSQNDNRTALHEAASLGNVDATRFLLDEGAKKDAKTKSKSTPLHEAAWAGSTEVVRLLVRAGAQKESRNLDDSTPLQLAALRGHQDVVKLLVDQGANVHTTRVSGRTPLEDARTKGHKEVAQILINAGASIPSRRTHREDEAETQWPGLF